MKILVPIKRVVDYNVVVRPTADKKNVDTENVKMSIEGKEIKKVIAVPQKLVNIVAK